MSASLRVMQGRDGAAALFDKLKVGAVVALQGKVQNHLHPAGSGGSSPHQQVLDVVVQEIRVLHKNRCVCTQAEGSEKGDELQPQQQTTSWWCEHDCDNPWRQYLAGRQRDVLSVCVGGSPVTRILLLSVLLLVLPCLGSYC